MKQYPLIENRFAKLFFGVYLTAMLFLSRDTLYSSCIVGFEKSQFYMIGLICLLGICFLIRNFREMKSILLNRRMLAVVITAVVLLIPMLLKKDWQMMYFSILLCPLFAIFLTYFTSVNRVAKHYVIILTLLGLYSLVAMYCLKELAQAGKIFPSVFFNSNRWDFYNFIFAYTVPWEYWHRNFGIFREPGVYQFFIILAVYLNNYAADWNRAWKLWVCNIILALTMVSTFAIGGYAELGLFALFLYFDKGYYRKTWGKILGVLAVLAVAGVFVFLIVQIRQPGFEQTPYYEFYDMFLRLFTKSDSATDRVSAITTNIQFFFRNPLVGNGIAEVLHGTNHNTSSTLLLYAIFGIVGGTLNVAAWAALTWKKERPVLGNLVLLLCLFMSFNTQNLVANIFFWLFPMMALMERGLPMITLSSNKE